MNTNNDFAKTGFLFIKL